MTESNAESKKQKLRDIARDVAEVHGFRLAWIEYHQLGPRTRLSVFIEKETGGITVDECAFYSSQLSARLDLEDIIPYTYNLEVSSPGLDRPLFEESDFARFQGSEIKAALFEEVNGSASVRGRIAEVKDGVIKLELQSGETLELELAGVKRANLVPELPW